MMDDTPMNGDETMPAEPAGNGEGTPMPQGDGQPTEGGDGSAM